MNANEDYTFLKTYRYERKFIASPLKKEEAEALLLVHPAGFKEIYYERFVNNIYFDTPALDFYYDNVEGRHDRIKVRIRWYGDFTGKINKPILEIKKKSGTVGTKDSFILPQFDFFSSQDLHKAVDAIKIAEIPDEIKIKILNLQPVLANRYKRKYFLDNSGKFRATIDYAIEYYPLINVFDFDSVEAKDYSKVVVELKYDATDNELITDVIGYLPFRLTKNSKYVTGIETFFNVVD
jgi:SPX domain protein involved in polyphosphate accumulation